MNLWNDDEDFLDVVGLIWRLKVNGNPIYIFTSKPRLLKPKLKTLHRHHTSHIYSKVTKVKTKWTILRFCFMKSSKKFLIAKRDLARRYLQLCKDDEAFYKQWYRI
jgi:hypothetical protein